MAKKIKITRDYGSLKKGETMELEDKIAEFLVSNQIAILICSGDCEECEDCKSKKKKRTPVKKTAVKAKPKTKKAPARKK